MADRCFYFGCWNSPGHFLYKEASGRFGVDDENVTRFGDQQQHLDGSLAPRLTNKFVTTWGARLPTERERGIEKGNSNEYPMGVFLRHVLDNGFTAIQWWDRCQGDKRFASNSTILFEGERTTAEVMAAGKLIFPHVFENLRAHSVELRELVKLGTLKEDALFVFANGYIDGVWRVGTPDTPGSDAPRCYSVDRVGADKPFDPNCWVIEEARANG